MITINKRFIVLLLILCLVVSLGACKDKKSADDDGNTGESSADVTGDAEELPPDEPQQDLTGIVNEADWQPMFPEFEDSIVWTAIPRDYIGGLGTHVNPKQDNTGYVNVREKPSIEAKVIGEIHHDPEIIWSVIDEYYERDGQLFVGSYKVKDGDYTWIPVEEFYPERGPGIRGWAAMEVLELWAI